MHRLCSRKPVEKDVMKTGSCCGGVLDPVPTPISDL